MKPIITFFSFFLIIFQTSQLIAQDQSEIDKVYMLSGDVNEGVVKSIDDETISFVYKGENLEYKFEKSKINKIIFSSGRTQVFNESSGQTVSEQPQAMVDSKNKLAVLPFTMISNEGSLTTEQMAEEVQHTTINSISENTRGIIVLDPMTTNSLLLKHNLNETTIKSKMPQEVAQLLGVEYIVYGTANINFEGTSTFGSSSTSYKDKSKKEVRSKKSSGTEFNSNSSSTTSNYDTTIELNIFNDNGQNLYSVKRNGFGSSLDKFESTINYLVKRSPWGTKRK